MAVSALIVSSCGTKKTEQKEGTHVHADGTVHEEHDHTSLEQETFEVKDTTNTGDSVEACCESAKQTEETHDHAHDHDHNHDHSHQ